MKTLLLIRHAESTAIAGGRRVPYDDDSPLSEKGCSQAVLMREFLSAHCPDIVLTSTLLRARQTAELLFGASSNQIANDGLDEFRLGPDGQGLETTEAGVIRATNCINRYRLAHGVVAAVAHNAILSVVRMSFLNAPWTANHEAFRFTGTCRVLRYDVEIHEEQWREIDQFVPPQ